MRILAIDPSTSTGWAIATVENETLNVTDYGIIDVTSNPYEGDTYLAYQQQIADLVRKTRPDVILTEDYFFSGRFASGAKENVAYRTVVHMVAASVGKQGIVLNPSEWKRAVTGSTQPNKIQKKKWGKQKAKKWMVQEALWEKFQFRFPNFWIHPDTGKTLSARSDYVDAVAFCVYYSRGFLNCKTFNIKSPEPDRPVKGKTFPY